MQTHVAASIPREVAVWRVSAVTAAVLAAAATAMVLLRWATPGGVPWRAVALLGRDPLTAMTAGCATAAWLVSSWLALGAACSLAGLLPGAAGRAASAAAVVLAPWTLRRLVGAAVGVSVVATGAAPPAPAFAAVRASATAPSVAAGWVSTAPAVAGAAEPITDARPQPVPWPDDPLARLDRPAPAMVSTDRATARRGVTPPALDRPDVGLVSPVPQRAVHPRPGPGPALVVVHRGDSLWAIAARHLGPSATDAEIATAWPRWWAANRAVIGPDPDLLLPGQRLTAPGR